MAKPSSLNPNQRIYVAVGAYVVLCQELEHLLKHLIAMTNADDPSITGILKRHAAQEKHSLGMTAGAFVKVSQGETEGLREHLRQIVTERNDIVHKLGEHYGSLIAEGKHEEVLAQLKDKFERALNFTKMLRGAALAILEAFRDGPFRNTDEYSQMAGLCESYRAIIERADAEMVDPAI